MEDIIWKKVLDSDRMRVVFMVVMVSLMSCQASFAQTETEEPDSLSLSMDLGELIVEGRTQQVIKDGIEYIPGKKIKDHSFDVSSLLSNMSLPQVKVWEKTISTVSGQPYAIYIDYIAASESDLTSLRPQDVLRVEVLKFPMDPRFSGQENVINFIMRKSERGGYTKLTAYGRVVTSSEVNGGVYQKLRLGRWTVDASVSGEGYRASDIGSSSTELFGGITFGGIHYDELKRETRDMLLSKTTNTQKATLRGAYSHDKTYISHTFSYTREAQPRNTSEGTVTYSHNLPSATSLSDETSQSINFSVGDTTILVLARKTSFRQTGVSITRATGATAYVSIPPHPT